MESKRNMIQPILFNQLVNWSVQYLLKSKVKYNQEYDLVNIGDFLTRNKTAVSIEDHKYYKRVTIKVRNGGVFLRDTEIGKNIGTKNQFLIKKGQFLLSKIDARNGAFGVVPEEVNGAIITGNFWTFDVDYSKINPHFLALITTTPEFISFCENASNGTTNRHYLQESSFLEQLIPLPPLEEQNSLVSSYKGKLALAIDQIRRAKELEHSIENYLFEVLKITKARANRRGKGLTIIKFHSLNLWGADKLLRGGNNSLLFSNKYANKKISEIADVNPRTDITKLKDSDQMSFIPMECVSDDFGEVIELRAGIKQTSKGYTKFQ
ncbi:MAG: restriction endonuclease subunit S, partial [Bacteroidetes bacterium]|nr:restriction endonuclease subunit S [Bacteroidota bacterium]